VGASSVGPGVSSGSRRRWVCGARTGVQLRRGWVPRRVLILVVFGEELGRGHRGAESKLLHEALHRPGTWGERERG